MKKLKDFANKKDFFKYLLANKQEIIAMKTASLKFTDAFGIDPLQVNANKSLNTSFSDDVASGMIKRSIILNTYMWMDSHDDVHLPGVFSKSIEDRKDKIWHLHDHKREVTAKVGRPESFIEKKIAWADLGVNLAGETEALVMTSNIMKDWNEKVFQQYLSKEINQHSVAMQYVTLDFAMNDPESKEEFAVYQKHIDKIGNRAKVEEQGYFFAISEATLIEGSCVLAGSNELTPTIENRQMAEQKIVTEHNNIPIAWDVMMKAITH